MVANKSQELQRAAMAKRFISLRRERGIVTRTGRPDAERLRTEADQPSEQPKFVVVISAKGAAKPATRVAAARMRKLEEALAKAKSLLG
jgi:hypothetical protein